MRKMYISIIALGLLCSENHNVFHFVIRQLDTQFPISEVLEYKYNIRMRKRLGILGIGLFGKWTISWSFDFLLYPVVISFLGIFIGGAVMTVLSFLVCYALILFYDRTKKDWIGIETLKEIEDFTPRSLPKSLSGRMIIRTFNTVGSCSAWLMKKSDAVLLFVLSIKFDPFITVIHIRHGAHQYNGLSKRDWRIFITSLIIGNAYWTLAVYMGITLVEAVWHLFARNVF